MTLLLLVKTALMVHGLMWQQRYAKILLLNTPNQIPIEGEVLGNHVFAMLGYLNQTN